MEKDMKAPYSWLKRINEQLIELDEKPLLRFPAAFDWKKFADSISSDLKIENLDIVPSKQLIWREGEEVTQGLGENCLFLSFSISPIEGDIFWVMSQADIAKLTQDLLVKNKKENGFTSSIMQEGFYRYLCLETLYSLEQMPTFENLSPKMIDTPSSSEQYALCMDISIKTNKHNCIGRLCLTPNFRKSWTSHFSSSPPISKKSIEKNLDVIIKMQAGHTKITTEEWDNIQVGDFVLLDRGNLNTRKNRGIITLVLGETPLFQAKIKQNKIKILDYTFYEEEKIDMEEKQTPEKEEITEEPKEEIEKEIEEEVVINPLEEKSSSIKEMPITITVEVARFRITMEKLMELQPGNFLELPISPEQGVNLTVHGKKVGRAELVNIGEALGIRILEIPE
jgi:flagellar motor switch protein FliN/FliY